MGLKRNDSNDFELDALADLEGVDSAKLTGQINKAKGIETPPSDDKKPIEDKKPPEDNKPPEEKKDVLNPETIRTAMLNEMFGEQFKTVEDFKKANIPAQLQERETLRQRNLELETQAKAKPKHHYASDDIAKFDEFARQTGIKDATIFNKLNASDVANMDAMDALILERVIDDPSLAGKEPQVRRTLERRFNVDSRKVESGELTQEELDDNLLEVNSEARKAKTKLQDLKGKIKMPEIQEELPPETKTKWTPEIEKVQKDGWTEATKAMVKEYEKIPIPIDGSDKPIIDFVLPEETRKLLMDKYPALAVGNQMEANNANVKSAAIQIYSEAILSNFGKIIKAVSERVRSLTEEEYLREYSNPSEKNTDKPDLKSQPLTDEEKAEKAFQAELNG